MKKILILCMATVVLLLVVACGGNDNGGGGTANNNAAADDNRPAPASDFSAGMVTDQNGINDQSFNQSSWDGLRRLNESIGAEVAYLESATPADMLPNMDRFYDRGKDIIWVIGFEGAEPVTQAAMTNPHQAYGIIDFNFGDDIQDNVVAVEFFDNEAAFLAGYLASRHSDTGVIGFIGGMDFPVIHRFESGFRAGAAYANNAHGLDVTVLVQYIGDFFSSDIARGISTAMLADGADVLYAAAGPAGQGAIDAAIDNNIYVIGVDLDQSHLAPNNMLTSTLKHVGEVIYDVSLRLSRGESVGGQNLVYGIAQGAVGITPFEGSTAALVDADVHADTMVLSGRIASGDLQIPENFTELDAFLADLG